jgi:uncharacterized membrane protein YeiH
MESFLSIIEILAVLAFAYSGVVEARRSGFDFVGVLTVAFVSAFRVRLGKRKTELTEKLYD